jgi:DICT domain-containing protein
MLKGSILQKLESAHQRGQVGKRPLNFGVYYKNTLVALCHALEDSILSSQGAPLVITAFQRGKWYLQEADRYRDLANRAQHVVIMASPDTGFAEHPTSQLANVDLVSLDTADPVAHEWHLIILSPTFSAMVLCQELAEADYKVQGVPTEDLERKFYGFWTFEAGLVQETIELAIEHVGQYNPDLQASLQQQLQAIQAASATAEREDISPAVARVVHYLQDSQHELNHQVHHQTSLHQTNLDNNLVSNEVQAFLRMAQLTSAADPVNPNAAVEVATLAEALGQLLDLPTWQLHRLRLAGLLHRLAPLQLTDSELSPGSSKRYSEDLDTVALSCPLVPGAQILRNMPRLRAIATIITHQTERWDGTGQPAKLAGDEIPLESRILGLVADFQARLATHQTATSDPSSSPFAQALAECQEQQGTHWDPKLVEALGLLVCGLQQGLSLPISIPKISAGMWLIDSHYEDDLLQWSIADNTEPAVSQ